MRHFPYCPIHSSVAPQEVLDTSHQQLGRIMIRLSKPIHVSKDAGANLWVHGAYALDVQFERDFEGELRARAVPDQHCVAGISGIERSQGVSDVV